MARSVNKIILVGCLGQDVDYRMTTEIGIVTNSLATNRREKDMAGFWVDKTDWHNLVFKNQVAEFMRDYACKGTLIYVEGFARTRKWKPKKYPGLTQYKTEVIVKEVQILGGKTKQQENNEPIPPRQTNNN